MLFSALASVPDDGGAPVPIMFALVVVTLALVVLVVTRQPADDVERCLRRLRVRDIADAPRALELHLQTRGLRPVKPWQVAAWLDGAHVPGVRPALDAFHLGGREGGRVLLRLTRGR